MPQPIFLDFLATAGREHASFQLVMGANVQRLLAEDGAARGVRYRDGNGWHEVRAPLTVVADGRFSRVRKLAGLRAIPTSSPVELLWFRLPRLGGDPEGTGIVSPRFGKKQILVMIDRADHWQVGYFFPVGDYPKLRAAGLEAMRRRTHYPAACSFRSRSTETQRIQRGRPGPRELICGMRDALVRLGVVIAAKAEMT